MLFIVYCVAIVRRVQPEFVGPAAGCSHQQASASAAAPEFSSVATMSGRSSPLRSAIAQRSGQSASGNEPIVNTGQFPDPSPGLRAHQTDLLPPLVKATSRSVSPSRSATPMPSSESFAQTKVRGQEPAPGETGISK